MEMCCGSNAQVSKLHWHNIRAKMATEDDDDNDDEDDHADGDVGGDEKDDGNAFFFPG